MRKALASLFLLSVALCQAQKGNIFPETKGHSLIDKSVTIPFKNNKYSVIAIAYHRDAETDLKKWIQPMYNLFIKKEKTEGTIDVTDLYDVNFVFIPLISGFKKHADEFKKGIDKELWPYIVDTEKTDIKTLQKYLSVHDTKIPYFYVLDKAGKIVDIESGKYEDIKLDKIDDAIE